MKLFDTHAHLDDEQLLDDAEAIVRGAAEANVAHIVAVGTTANSSDQCVTLAERFPSVLAAVGIQPNYCAEASSGDWPRIKQLSQNPNAVALGETGLDRYWDHTPFDMQVDYFDRHLRWSQETGLPVIVHMRDCGDEILDRLSAARKRGVVRGVMHSFTGDQSLADACLELGMDISFAGMVTYKKSKELREVARSIPADRLLIETDSPYLSPEPCRGQRPNQPALLVHTARCLADARGIALPDLARITTENAYRLFGVRVGGRE